MFCAGIAVRSSLVGTVQAAGFSTKSLSGGYGFSLFTLGAASTGVFIADGNGKITAGQETVNVAGNSCHGTLSGTYTVDGDGAGVLTLFLAQDAPSNAKGCQPLAAHYSFAITDSGQQLPLAEQDAAVVAYGIGIKQ